MSIKDLYAYELQKEEDLKGIKAKGYLLRHRKSGARVVYIENDDNNKVFSIGFRTPPSDSTGVPHIMEHSVLCGSKNFPAKDPFVELVKGSLNTFLNAMTYPDKTVYPVASCNDKDFQNLMHVYMDAVFYPNIYEHEEIFRQEGWSYQLDSAEDKLKYNGVVYNEMKGAFSSPEGVLDRVILNTLFPDTSYANEFEAIYAHFGQAVYAIPYLENIDNLNGLQLEGSVYFRTEDRKAPHNAYTSGERLLQGIQEKGYAQTYSENYINNNGHYQFAQSPSETLLESGIPASTVALDNYTDNHPWFEYNSETKEYERNQYGEPQIDLETGQQLTCDNIILQNSQYVPYDENGYLNIFCTGEGEGTFITRGKAIPIKWVYEEEHGMIHYYDENGQEIRLNPGKTWVEIILNGTEDAVSIQ